jgi:hypothetical protein
MNKFIFIVVLCASYIQSFDTLIGYMMPSYIDNKVKSMQEKISNDRLLLAVYHSSVNEIADMYCACLFLNRHNKHWSLDGFNFIQAEKIINSRQEPQESQKTHDAKSMFTFNSFIFGISLSTLLYSYFRPINIDLLNTAAISTATSTLYYMYAGYTYCKKTESQKILEYLAAIKTFNIEQSKSRIIV